MDYKTRLRQIPLGILVGLITLVLASGGSVAWFTWRTLNPRPPVAEFPTLDIPPEITTPLPDTTTPDDSAATPDTPDSDPVAQAPSADVDTQVYWLKDDGTGFQLVPQTVAIPRDASSSAQVAAAFEALLAQSGDPSQDAFSTIPEDTRLLSAEVKADGVHVNLSSAFETGGGSASMIGRLGQVIYTATAFDPSASVWLSVDGQALTLLGGEGLEIRQPMTRNTFNQDFQL
ncbi:GerMN domain-containing protein [Nodosilinea sp. P-1105]|uniref:GerMN domain-containing protein n=1 Tax=Nodosilinea sp. P-1105 TaxID=2546229 RepID=UPI00146A4F54|nr:GerMN domain-containing protein [Nodosilinea sp. P-1105]NMF85237.1 spore germination protein [Nodosilinea sp. P-1105]